MAVVKHVPGGWVTVLVGGAAFLYIVGKQDALAPITKLKEDTIDAFAAIVPGHTFGVFLTLFAVGSFLNRETAGK